VVSLLLLIVSASQSPVRRMGLDPKEKVYVDAKKNPEAVTIPGIAIEQIYGPLFFADANNFRTAVLDMVEEHQPHTVVIDLDAATMIDMDGVEILTKISGELRRREVNVYLARVDTKHIELFKRIGAMDEIGEQNIFPTVRAAVSAAERTGTGITGEMSHSSEQSDNQENQPQAG
jgi:MFS superfamily sulfate permease-like transporter